MIVAGFVVLLFAVCRPTRFTIQQVNMPESPKANEFIGTEKKSLAQFCGRKTITLSSLRPLSRAAPRERSMFVGGCLPEHKVDGCCAQGGVSVVGADLA